MTADDSSLPELQELLDGLLNHSLNREQLEHLQELLKSSEAARAQYLVYVDLHYDLLRIHSQVGDLPSNSGSLIEWLSRQDLDDSCCEVRQPIDNGAVALPSDSWQAASALRPSVVWRMGLAAVFLLIVGGLWAAWTEPEAAAVMGDVSDSDRPSGISLAQVASAKLYGESLPPLHSDMALGREYALTSGSIQLKFPKGATAIIEAPAVFELASTSRLSMKTGVCSVHAPDGAQGFRVDTPLADGVDLGTRFVVSVSQAGDTSVQVIEGEAELYPNQSELPSSGPEQSGPNQPGPAITQTPYEQQLTYLVDRHVEAEYGGLEGAMKSDDKDRVLALKRQLESLQAKRPRTLPQAMAVTGVGPVAPPTLMPKRQAETIAPGFPTIMATVEPTIEPLSHSPDTTGRRAALAKWLTEPTHPLTSRVMVNRIWQWYFGRGLAPNTSDFGRLGDIPSHPELLDYLAAQLVDSGWRLKPLHRLVLLSATYRQSTEHKRYADQQGIDPQNRYYWRANTRRLQAEQVRDSLLLVSGKLDPREGGAGVQPDVPRRSIYTRMMRNSPDVLLDSFDLPPLFSSNSSRNLTTTPVQSLMLINSDMLMTHARNLAKTVSEEGDNVPSQIKLAWWRVFGRAPTNDEAASAMQFIQNQTEYLHEVQDSETPESIIATAKLPYRDGQAARFTVGEEELSLRVPHQDDLNTNEFTIETFFQLRSIDQGAAVRTIVAKWDGNNKTAGWSFGVTGKGSRRKPQTLVIQLTGRTVGEGIQNRAIFSDQHVETNKPYYAAASVTLAKNGQPGSITFYLKDLSNDDAPLSVVSVDHDVEDGVINDLPITFGSVARRGAGGISSFDGLVDDVRLLREPLDVDSLLFTAEKAIASTIGYWQAEPSPGVMENSVNEQLKVEAKGRSVVKLSPSEAALVDFCHSLLNTNEFLYVH